METRGSVETRGSMETRGSRRHCFNDTDLHMFVFAAQICGGSTQEGWRELLISSR